VAHSRLPAAAAVAALALAFHPLAAMAQDQSNPGWFVPHRAAPHPVPAARPAARQALPAPGVPGDAAGVPQQIQVQLPPMPKIPEVNKGAPPPAAIIGVLNVPAVLHLSTAYEQALKVMNDRQKELNTDRQKEEETLNKLSRELVAERGKLSPEKIRQKEREFQDRVAESRRKFGERARILQEAGQYVWLQIDRVVETVAQQVAAARGINIVLNRAQILGATPEFDLSPEVAKVVNEALPKVDIPPPDVSPLTLHPAKAEASAKPEESHKADKKAPAKAQPRH